MSVPPAHPAKRNLLAGLVQGAYWTRRSDHALFRVGRVFYRQRLVQLVSEADSEDKMTIRFAELPDRFWSSGQ